MAQEQYPITYKIEKGVPIIERKYGRSSAFKQLRDYMEVGDSVVVDSMNKYRAIYAYFEKHGRKVTYRKLSKNEFRIWRIK